MSSTENVNFLSYFDDLDDPRMDINQLHSLSDILLIMLCGVICGAESCRDFTDFGESKIDYLKRFTDLDNGIPSKNTFNRVLSTLNPEAFKKCFIRWVESFQVELGKVIAIDGKVLRRSFDKASEQSAICMVSAFATEAKLVLAQQKVDEKSNEITAIPKLLELLELTGAIVTLDAMGCQKAIVEQVIEAGGDYVIAVKGNQETLHKEISHHFSHFLDMQSHRQTDVHKVEEKNRGRQETRTCISTSELSWLGEKEKWRGLKSVVAIEGKRKVKGKVSKEVRYYISSLEANSKELSQVIRSHWGIENSLHWILDMTFREDECRARKEHGAENMAMMKHAALNQLQRAKPQFAKDMSIKRLRKKAGWDDKTLDTILMATN